MTLREFNIEHQKWCARIGKKVCGRCGRNLASPRCKDCVIDFLDAQSKFELLETKGTDQTMIPINAVDNVALAEGLKEMMSNIKNGRAPYLYPIGSRGVFGTMIFEVIGHNCQSGVKIDYGSDTIKVVAPKTMTLRLYTQDYYESSLSAQGKAVEWGCNDINNYLQTKFNQTIPEPLREVMLMVENKTIWHNIATGENKVRSTMDTIWLPSASQLGFTDIGDPVEGSALPAFDDKIAVDSKAKRAIVEYRGDQIVPKSYWTRTTVVKPVEGTGGFTVAGVAVTPGGNATTLRPEADACMVVPYIVIGPKEE